MTASVSISAPLPVFTSITPGRMRVITLDETRWCVSAVSGQFSVTMWLRSHSSSSST